MYEYIRGVLFIILLVNNWIVFFLVLWIFFTHLYIRYDFLSTILSYNLSWVFQRNVFQLFSTDINARLRHTNYVSFLLLIFGEDRQYILPLFLRTLFLDVEFYTSHIIDILIYFNKCLIREALLSNKLATTIKIKWFFGISSYRDWIIIAVIYFSV